MLHGSPSLGLAKFFWTKPLESNSAPITVTPSGDIEQLPIKLDAVYVDSENTNSSSNNVIQPPHSTEETSSTQKISGVRAFWSHKIRTTEEKLKQHLEQKSSDQKYPVKDYNAETGKLTGEQ